MNRESNKRLYVELLRGNFQRILSELDLVYKLNHNGEKGKEAEEILKNFLKKYLPEKYQVTTGFVHSDLGISKQSDILLYDAVNYPPLYSGYANNIIHISSLRAVIECTMRLDKKKLEEDNRKISSLKAMYNNDEEIQGNMSRAPLTVLFAYKSSGKILEYLNKLTEKNFDIVFCADGQLYILRSDTNLYSNNVVDGVFSGETLHGYTFTKEQHAFSFFYSYLIDLLNTVTSDFNEYRMVHEYSKSSIYVDYEEY